MDQSNENPIPGLVLQALADIPPLPPHLYGAIIWKINRKRALVRFAFGLAASLLIAVSTFTVVRLTMTPASYSADVAEELNGVNSYFNGDVYRENSNSYGYYEETSYQE